MTDTTIETIGPIELSDGSVLVGKVEWDEDGGSYLDCPRDDNSGEDAWEWIEFDSGGDRNEWIASMFCCAECGSEAGYPDEACSSGYDENDKHVYPDAFRPGLDFWIERYEHSMVRYAPTNESSVIDRQWDVAPGVAILRFREGHGCGDRNDPDGVLNFVRAICSEYTDWCNGAVYGYVIERWLTIAHYETDPDEGELIDSCWGFIGSNDHGTTYAEEELRSVLDQLKEEANA